MKHLLPELMSLLRTDMDVLDTDLSTLTIPSSTSLVDAFCLFDTSSYLFIQDDGPLLGYIAVSDVLHAMMHAHRLIEAYFETTLETAGSALTLINEDAKVAYWTTGAEHVFSISKKTSSDNPQRTFSSRSATVSQDVIYRRNGLSQTASATARPVRPY